MGWEKIIGGNLRRFRQAQGMTQEGLAAEVHLDVRQIGRIERGQSFPSIGLLVHLSEILCVQPGQFFEREL